ncbi:MAG: TetR/AcrR family transcriptional regulator [Jatrophihabitans sp.]
MTKAAAQQRRTQDERSSAMRERLLEATIGCLVEYGYTGTTVTRIAERAGVTRGAQVHHYRTKDDLVTAAVAHLAGRSAEFGWARVAAVAEAPDTVGSLLDVLWELHKGPTFTATVELWVAARTDGELRAKVGSVEPVLLSSLHDVADRAAGVGLSPDVIDDELLDAVYTAMDAMRGLMISIWHLPACPRTARWRRARERLRLLFPPTEQVRQSLDKATAALAG